MCWMTWRTIFGDPYPAPESVRMEPPLAGPEPGVTATNSAAALTPTAGPSTTLAAPSPPTAPPPPLMSPSTAATASTPGEVEVPGCSHRASADETTSA